ncbi:DUF2752 domain-containing protein [Oligoflexus tunisiensis]|uniref:DUF2752 domain-containing protein n=1 Tax=Oligoflexus tunisiensis TaxID=708132 RepID=UPI001C404438|nr:DUF2752 domain-containing protein [Oligoflexus tunisiensis]
MGIRDSKRAIAGILLVLFWIGLGLVHDLPLSAEGWAALVPLRCPLSFLFDIQCPTCGLGRSLVAAALFHGRESLHFHPLGLPLFWGGQILLLGWMLGPRSWSSLFSRGRDFVGRHQLLLWLVIALYSLWGFCWRVPL